MYENRLIEAILIHIHNIWFYGELMIIKVKTLVFCENLLSTETFTWCVDSLETDIKTDSCQVQEGVALSLGLAIYQFIS